MGANYRPEQYQNKLIMAPMVKIGTLPARLLSLSYGADIVYTEEIVDWKLLKCKRIVNECLGTIDYYDEAEDAVVFRTCKEERGRVILQIGTCDPDRAVQVVKLVQNDIAGIDVNMGCPKDFSIKGGMGAALLKQPEKVKAILTSLVENSDVPVTCKIRVLSDVEATIELAKLIQSCGVSALAVHGRTKDERQQHSNRNHYIQAVARHLNIPVIANGGSREIDKFDDILKFKEATGCSSVMLARAAEWNPSVFRAEGKIEIHTVIEEYLRLAIRYQNAFPNTKYNIQNVLREQQESPLGKLFLASVVMQDICKLWNLQEYFKEESERQSRIVAKPVRDSDVNDNLEGDMATKRLKLDNETESSDVTVVPNCAFIRGLYEDPNKLPKSVVLRWYLKNGFGNSPVYEITSLDKKFRSTLDVGGQKFRTNTWEKSKRHAEQAAAMAFLKYMNLDS